MIDEDKLGLFALEKNVDTLFAVFIWKVKKIRYESMKVELAQQSDQRLNKKVAHFFPKIAQKVTSVV